MAVPLIITVSPTTGSTGGRNTVEVRGNNFRLPPEPPPGKTSGKVPETVRVYFGNTPATNVQVISHARLLCVTPQHSPGIISVAVENIDDDGVAIPGESASKASAYTFQRPDLTVKSDFTKLVGALVVQLRNQVLENTVVTTHTDYDADTTDYLNLVEVGQMPALILIGPTLTENRFFSTNQFQTDIATDGIEIRRVPYTVDLGFTLVGVAELTVQLLDLMAATVQFINRTRYLQTLCDPSDPSSGFIQYEIDFPDSGGEPSVSNRVNNSNVRTFSASLVVRGFDMAGSPADMISELSEAVADVILVDVEQFSALPELSSTVLPPFAGIELTANTGELQSQLGREFTIVWPARGTTAQIAIPDTGMVDDTYTVEAIVITAPSGGKAGTLSASGLATDEFTLTSTAELEPGTTVRVSIVDV